MKSSSFLSSSSGGRSTGASTGIKAYRVGKMALRGTSDLAKAMHGKLVGANAMIIVRYAVGNLDEAHHIIPKGGPPISWGADLRTQCDCIRANAKKQGSI